MFLMFSRTFILAINMFQFGPALARVLIAPDISTRLFSASELAIYNAYHISALTANKRVVDEHLKSFQKYF